MYPQTGWSPSFQSNQNFYDNSLWAAKYIGGDDYEKFRPLVCSGWDSTLRMMKVEYPTEEHEGPVFISEHDGVTTGSVMRVKCVTGYVFIARCDEASPSHGDLYGVNPEDDADELSELKKGGIGFYCLGYPGSGSNYGLFASYGWQSYIGEATDLTYTGEHTEAARTDDYESGYDETDVLFDFRDKPTDKNSVKITMCIGFCYNNTGDKKLYAYMADFHYNDVGSLVKIEKERRVEIDAAESC